MKHIQSRDNPLFKQLVKINESARHRNGLALLDGTHLLSAYLDSSGQPQQVILHAAALQNPEVQQLLARLGDTPLVELDDALYRQLSSVKTASGILTLINRPQPQLRPSQFAVFLEDIQDPGNLGSIIRTAAAAGCDALYLSAGCADAWSPKVLRAAMGGHFALDIHEQQPLPALAAEFDGTVLASSLQAQHALYDCNLHGKLALLFGNEGAGLSPALAATATQTFIIPMPGQVESLNVAAAAAVCLFEAVRQRRA